MTTPDEPTLIPPGDDVVNVDDDVEAAAASALAAAASPAVVPPEPWGTAWLFYFREGRFVRRGDAPVEVEGLEALKLRIEMTIRVQRHAHPVFDGTIGVAHPDQPIGEVDVREIVADYTREIRAAVERLDPRISEVTLGAVDYDPTTGILSLGPFEVITDDDQAIKVDGIDVPNPSAS